MHFKIDGKTYRLPNQLSEITLWDRIGYDKEHGKELRAMMKKIVDIKDKNLQELELGMYGVEVACRSLSYWGKIPLKIVHQTAIEDVFAAHFTMLKMLSEETDFTSEHPTIDHEMEWNGETWCIHPVELKQESKMTFGEFIDSKQIVQNLYELGDEKWEALLMLCCIYLRKKGEPYSRQLSAEGGERYELMKTLPMNMALHVGFFLKDLTATYTNTFRSFGPQRQDQAASQ